MAVVLAAGAAGASPASIVVRADRATGAVSPFVLGHNLESGDSYGIFGTSHDTEGPRTGGGVWDPGRGAPVPEAVRLAREIRAGMMRFPGGCLVHGYDWRKAVGPPASRPSFAFGPDEFVSYCRAVGAEPLFTVSDYSATPEDAADLVRHLRPLGVRYYEMGNESDHGNHDLVPQKKWTPGEYAAWVNDCARRMRSVDPGVKLGVLMGTGTGPEDSWNAVVLKATGANADFVVVHAYAVGAMPPDGVLPGDPDVALRAAISSVDRFEEMLGRYRTLIRREAGRDIPLAITEYNAMFVQDKPRPYRFSLAAALFSADFLRVMLNPASGVLMANYWQFANGYWGSVRGPDPWREQAAFRFFRLWGRHFGTPWVETRVDSPRIEFEGYPGFVGPARGDRHTPETALGGNLLAGKAVEPVRGRGWRTEIRPGGTLAAVLDGLTGEAFPPMAEVKAPPGYAYRVSFEARSMGDLGAANMGLGLVDRRGWEATRSANAVEGAGRAAEWTRFAGTFRPLPDCPGAYLVWRLRAGLLPVTGTVEVRNLAVEALRPEIWPAYPALTAAASLAADGKTLFVIVFNRHHRDAVPARISVRGWPAGSVRRWTVTGENLASMNVEKDEVRETESGIPTRVSAASVIAHVFPPRSMTAFEIGSR
jgi:alpha-N-arabinofuranosidase